MIPWLLLLLSCRSPPPEPGWAPRHLDPYPNPFGPDDPRWTPQPPRDNPVAVAVDGAGDLWVALQGAIDEPRQEVVWVERSTGRTERLDVGVRSLTGLAVHPGGRWLVALGRYSDGLAVVDTEERSLAGHLPVDFYATDAAFSADGRELWVADAWRDEVAVFDVEVTSTGLRWSAPEPTRIPVLVQPRDLAISANGRWVAVGSAVSLEASLIDRAARVEVRRLPVGAPTSDVGFVDDLLLIPTFSRGSHHPATHGPDTDGDGLPGDGTPNTDFSDLQNELSVVDATTGVELWRYTSDTICCAEAGDVKPTDPDGDLLPDPSLWIVGGSLPEQLVTVELDGAWWAYVTYSASNQVQRFQVDRGTGALTPDPAWDTRGHNPFGLAVDGDELLVAHRLGETLGRYDARTGEPSAEVVVGDLSAGAFPATEAELGELMFFVTPLYADDDGDRACSHCHRDMGLVDRPIDLISATYPGMGLRMNFPLRGMLDTLPWLWEASGDEDGFRLESPSGGGAQGGGDPDILARFLIDAPYLLPNPNDPEAPAARRGKNLFEREDVQCATCHPAPTFAISTTNNPVGLPLRLPPVISPLRGPHDVNLDLVSEAFLESFPETEQDRCEDVCDPDLCAEQPRACDHLRTLAIGVPSLRGLWTHPPSWFHHGLANSLREVLLPPGHPALLPGEVGYNERDGVPGTHGGADGLSPAEVDDLIAYLLTL